MQSQLEYFKENPGMFDDKPSGPDLVDVGLRFNEFIEQYVFDVYTSLVDVYAGTIDNIFLIYILFYLIAAMRGAVKTGINDMVFHYFMLAFVYVVLFHWAEFAGHAYHVIVFGPSEIINVILSVVKDYPGGGAPFVIPAASQALSKAELAKGPLGNMELYLAKGLSLFDILWDKDGWKVKLFALLVIGITLWFSTHAIGLIVYSQISVAVLLSIAPIFMLFLLFKNTRGWFEGWMRALMTKAVLQIMVFSLLAMSLTVLSYAIQEIEAGLGKNEFTLRPFMPFLSISAAASYFLAQTWGEAAAIGGGFSAKAWQAYNDSGGFIRATRHGINASVGSARAAGRTAKNIGKNL